MSCARLALLAAVAAIGILPLITVRTLSRQAVLIIGSAIRAVKARPLY